MLVNLTTVIKKFKWTPVRVIAAGFGLWLLLLALFSEGRICDPVMSARCVRQAWNYVGDVIWLRNLYAWQTMVTGLLALLAAGIGAWIVYLQFKLERDRRQRLAVSVRAIMPHTLASLMDYLERVAVALRAMSKREQFELPQKPVEVIAHLQQMVEVGPDFAAPQIASLIGDLQVLDSRLQALSAGTLFIQDNSLEVVRLHAVACMLFSFARAETDDLPTSEMVAGQYFSSLRMLKFDTVHHSKLYDAAARRTARITGKGEPETEAN